MDLRVPALRWRPLVAAGMVLGVGLGGFLDGILLHQILQVHSMVSHRLSPDTLAHAEINMFWDGIFHLFTWSVTVAGLYLLWRALKRADVPFSGRALVGALLLGWGVFNLGEGVVNHHLLELHHVVERAEGSVQAFWDIAFLLTGPLLGGAGALMISRERLRWNRPDLGNSQDRRIPRGGSSEVA